MTYVAGDVCGIFMLAYLGMIFFGGGVGGQTLSVKVYIRTTLQDLSSNVLILVEGMTFTALTGIEF